MTKEIITIETLKDWMGRVDPGNDLHLYFDDSGLVDWVEIYEEGVKVWNLMFGDEIEIPSPSSDLIAAVAAQSSFGAFLSVARALGVNPYDLKSATEEYYGDNGQCLPMPSLGYKRLRKRIEKFEKIRLEINVGNNF